MPKYEVYQPRIHPVTLYDGKFGTGEYPYNHMVSVEWFNGLFYAVWGAHRDTNKEGQPGQINVLATSTDFVNWTHPVDLSGPEVSENPVIYPEEVYWQPDLLNVDDEELWCMWSFGKERCTTPTHPGWQDPESGKGLYLSRLSKEPGAKWRHKKIMGLVEMEGRHWAPFVSQNPFLCDDGRVIAPLTLVHDVVDEDGQRQEPIRMSNVCAWTDDASDTWELSNPLTRVDEYYVQWEPFFFQQADGRIRGYLRNFLHGGRHITSTQWQLTCVSNVSRKGEPIVFDRDPQYAYIETGRTRAQAFRAPGDRYCLLMNDVDTHQGARFNQAVYFSRTGNNDFVASLPYSPRFVYATYSQGVAHDDKLYVAYTTTENKHHRWRIRGAIYDPAPAPDTFYIWPREKCFERNEFVYAAQPLMREWDGRQTLQFAHQASAGVEVDPVDFEAGQGLTVSFDVMVLSLQDKGNLVLCSLGDKMPIRIGMPSNRPDRLYAWGYDEWQPVGYLPRNEWHRITIRFGRDSFSVRIDEGQEVEFRNPIVAPTPRLYLGDGYTVDEIPSNLESDFAIDIDTFETEVK